MNESNQTVFKNKVLNEQLTILGDDKDKNPSYEEISEMKYLEKVIKECQRLYPSVPVVARYTDRDYDISNFINNSCNFFGFSICLFFLDGKIFPKGVSVNLFLMAMGYNEKYHTDPYRFNPDRFDPENVKKEGHSTFEYVPFSAGPRNCIGQLLKCIIELRSLIKNNFRSEIRNDGNEIYCCKNCEKF